MRRLVMLLDVERFEVIGLTRIPDNVDRLPVRLIAGDLRDAATWSRHLKGCKLVIHAAAVTHAHDPQAYFQTNLQATKQLVDFCRRHEVEKFVFISTRAATFDAGAYGVSKLLAERYIQENFNAWIILRPGEIYGTGGSEGVEKLIKTVLHNRVIFCPAQMPGKLYPIHVKDVATCVHQVVFENPGENRILTITGQEGYTYIEMVRTIAKAAKRRVLLIPVPRMAMQAAAAFIRAFRLHAPFAPDQVARLYAAKAAEIPLLETVAFKDYVLDRNELESK